MSQRISPSSFPIAASATALDYAALEEQSLAPAPVDAALAPVAEESGEEQRLLFRTMTSEGRVIPFDSLTSRSERQSIRARMAGLERPEPVRTGKVEVRRARKPRSAASDLQRPLDFRPHSETAPQSRSEIICDALVAPAGLRLRAALIDLFLMVIPMVVGVALFFYAGGEVSSDKHALPFFLLALATVPVFYKLLWTIAGSDTIGMKAAGLVLVDFDGNPPSKVRRYLRCAGASLSLLAAGIGMVWSFLDEDRLTWHDHISSTFPTVAEN